jgi:hypothetical protein
MPSEYRRHAKIVPFHIPAFGDPPLRLRTKEWQTIAQGTQNWYIAECTRREREAAERRPTSWEHILNMED